MSVDTNKAIVRRLFEEVYNQRRFDVIDAILDAEYAAFEKPWLAMLLEAFPDLHMTVEQLIGEGERVVAVITTRGTHLGELKGELISWLTDPLAATGRRVEVRGIFVYGIVEGKLSNADRDGLADWLTVLRQLGVATPAYDVAA